MRSVEEGRVGLGGSRESTAGNFNCSCSQVMMKGIYCRACYAKLILNAAGEM